MTSPLAVPPLLVASVSAFAVPASAPRRDQLTAAGEAFLVAGEALSEAANRLPHFYSSKQGLTDENPAVFGGGGQGLTQAGEALLASDAAEDCAVSRARHRTGQRAEPAKSVKEIGRLASDGLK